MRVDLRASWKLAGIVLASVLLFIGGRALAQTSIHLLCDGDVELSWEDGSGRPAAIFFDRVTADGGLVVGDSLEPSTGPHGLSRNTRYQLFVDWGDGSETHPFTTSRERCRRPEPPSRAPDITCPLLPPSVVVSGYGQFTQCKRVGAAGVAIPALVARGIIEAVDIFGVVDAAMRVCFRERGELKFLDAAAAPRAAADLAAEVIGGMTCGVIDRAGTVVLLPGSAAVGQARAEAGPAATVETAATVGDRADICELITTGYLSLRGGPSVNYARLDAMPVGVRLLGAARAGDWYLVEYEGLRGWSSGMYLTKSSGCAGIGESTRVFLPLSAEAAGAEAEGGAAEMEPEMEPAVAAVTAPGAWALTYCSLTAGDIINQRAGPGLEYDIIAEIPYRTNLRSAERTRDWFRIEYDGETGWVHLDYVFREGCG